VDLHAFNRKPVYECLRNVWEIIVDWYDIPNGSQLLVAVRRGHLPEMQRASPAPTNNRQGLAGRGAKNM